MTLNPVPSYLVCIFSFCSTKTDNDLLKKPHLISMNAIIIGPSRVSWQFFQQCVGCNACARTLINISGTQSYRAFSHKCLVIKFSPCGHTMISKITARMKEKDLGCECHVCSCFSTLYLHKCIMTDFNFEVHLFTLYSKERMSGL